MKNDPISVIIVDDHQMVRETWKMILDKHARITVIAECASAKEAIEAAVLQKPDVMLMDINMYPVNGLKATQEILRNNPEARIIGVSVNNQAMYARTMMQSGAKGYVTKNSPMTEMIHAIIEVHNGNTYICKEISDKNADN
jgi:DNA-binding NarL/FixJ family response regulator